MAVKLQFVREPGLASSAIAWFTEGHYSHVDAVNRHGMLLGARLDGVRLRSPDYAYFLRRTVVQLPCTAHQEAEFWTFLEDQLGKPYDRKAIWGFVAGRDWREDDSWICSELQAAGLEQAKVFGELLVNTWKVTPAALAIAATAAGGEVILDDRRT